MISHNILTQIRKCESVQNSCKQFLTFDKSISTSSAHPRSILTIYLNINSNSEIREPRQVIKKRALTSLQVSDLLLSTKVSTLQSLDSTVFLTYTINLDPDGFSKDYDW